MTDEEPELLDIATTPWVDPAPAVPTTRPLPPLLSEILAQETDVFAGDAAEETETRDRLLQQLRALPSEPWFSTAVAARLDVVKHVFLLLRPTRLSVEARIRVIQRIMRAWEDGTDEYEQWLVLYLPPLLVFLCDFAADQLLPSKWQRAWWHLSSP